MTTDTELAQFDGLVDRWQQLERSVDAIIDSEDFSLIARAQAEATLILDMAKRAGVEWKRIGVQKLRLERAAGSLLDSAQRNPPGPSPRDEEIADRRSAISEYRMLYEAAGIVERQAQRWKKLATGLSDTYFEKFVSDLEEPTLAAVLKEVRRLDRERAAAARAAAVPEDLSAIGTFSLIYADPPWRYEHAEPSRAVENNYPTMDLQDIRELPVPAEDDAVLFLWATNPKLEEALSVVKAWGFDYRTNMVWVKPHIGMGYYVRGQHELLLIARRGDLPVPSEANRPPSVVEATVGDHSEKPAVFYEIIERMYPSETRLEMFARETRPGWRAWGNAPVG